LLTSTEPGGCSASTKVIKGSMVGFKLPDVEDNAEGWGPTSEPKQFADVPFMPFGKGERLGRIAEFGSAMGRNNNFQSKHLN
jgi:translation initiation factor 3 subunit D